MPKNVSRFCYDVHISQTKGQLMNQPLNIQDYINSYYALDKVHFPISADLGRAYADLACRFSVWVGFGFTKNEMQKMLDEMTASNVQELSNHNAKVGA
jgi:hypothetical protein